MPHAQAADRVLHACVPGGLRRDVGQLEHVLAHVRGGFSQRQLQRVAGSASANGGKGCSLRSESKLCNAQSCPVDCVTAMWGDWGECSASCDGGTSRRYRSVVRMFAHGGKPCGQFVQTASCNTEACPIKNCDYTGWSEWQPCSAQGSQFRTRDVAQQADPGGVQCQDSEKIQTRNCAINCQLSDWGDWSACTATCCPTGANCGRHSRTRSVVVPAQYGGTGCATQREQETGCNNGACHAVPCGVTQWGSYTACDKTCGAGEKIRRRNWLNTAAYQQTVDGTTQTVACRIDGAKQMKQVVSCSVYANCPRDCVMSTWGTFTLCDKTCGGGKRRRFRMRKVSARYGGLACGAFLDEADCNTDACPVDCEFTAWGPWAPVHGQGGTLMARNRTITREEANGGKQCPSTFQTRRFTELCQNDVKFSRWTDCTKTCGSGYRYRYREMHLCSKTSVIKYKVRHRQGERCNTHDCPTEREQAMLRGAV